MELEAYTSKSQGCINDSDISVCYDPVLGHLAAGNFKIPAYAAHGVDDGEDTGWSKVERSSRVGTPDKDKDNDVMNTCKRGKDNDTNCKPKFKRYQLAKSRKSKSVKKKIDPPSPWGGP